MNDEQEIEAIKRAARMVRLLAKEFADGSWGPTIDPLPRLDDEIVSATKEKNPEWIRLPVKGRCPYTGLSRSTLYNLVSASAANDCRPPVKSIVLRRRGAARGVRLISYDSLMDYLAAAKNAQCPE